VAGEPLTFSDLARHAQEIQQQLLLARAELAETELTGTAGGGLVTVTMRGDGEVTRVVFDQAAVDEGDAESLARLTLAAMRHATDAVKSLTTERMAAVSAGFQAALGSEASRRLSDVP
jgi:DNA-binding YbaB/EbfC family protein